MINEPNHTCRTCGKEYHGCDYCEEQHTFTPWKSVCCSIECYSKYLDAVLAARGELESVTVKTVTPIVEEVVTEKETTDEETDIRNKRK